MKNEKLLVFDAHANCKNEYIDEITINVFKEKELQELYARCWEKLTEALDIKLPQPQPKFVDGKMFEYAYYPKNTPGMVCGTTPVFNIEVAEEGTIFHESLHVVLHKTIPDYLERMYEEEVKEESFPFFRFINEVVACLGEYLLTSPPYDQSWRFPYFYPVDRYIEVYQCERNRLKETKKNTDEYEAAKALLVSKLADAYVTPLVYYLREMKKEKEGFKLIKEMIEELKSAIDHEKAKDVLNKFDKRVQEYREEFYQTNIDMLSKKIQELTRARCYYTASMLLSDLEKWYRESGDEKTYLLVESLKRKAYSAHEEKVLKEIEKVKETDLGEALGLIEELKRYASDLGIAPSEKLQEIEEEITEKYTNLELEYAKRDIEEGRYEAAATRLKRIREYRRERMPLYEEKLQQIEQKLSSLRNS